MIIQFPFSIKFLIDSPLFWLCFYVCIVLSIQAANGAYACNILQVFIEYRGASWR